MWHILTRSIILLSSGFLWLSQGNFKTAWPILANDWQKEGVLALHPNRILLKSSSLTGISVIFVEYGRIFGQNLKWSDKSESACGNEGFQRILSVDGLGKLPELVEVRRHLHSVHLKDHRLNNSILEIAISVLHFQIPFIIIRLFS